MGGREYIFLHKDQGWDTTADGQNKTEAETDRDRQRQTDRQISQGNASITDFDGADLTRLGLWVICPEERDQEVISFKSPRLQRSEAKHWRRAHKSD